jgi:DNA replication and repair protein RecF
MIITGIALQNFRLHKNYFLKFTNKTTVIIGDNAIGKTSIIEALNLLATGNSFRAGKIEEMVDFDSELARVKGVILDNPSVSESKDFDSMKNILENPEDPISTEKKEIPQDEVEVILTRGVVNGRRTQHRLFSVNGVRRRKKDAIGKFYTVVFRPEDMRLIEGSKGRRRSFLDTVLSLLYIEYEMALKNYDQTLKRRNKLLQQVREKKQPRTVLHYWNLNLVKYGEIIQQHRQEFLETFKNVKFPVDFSVEYDPSLISTQRMEQYKDKEVIVGHTLIGPHKDDLIVSLEKDGRKLRLDAFGSRGQQRLGVLWLKFCELEYLKNQSKANTLLLLDDILSELDNDSKALALSVLENYQSVVTTTEQGVLEDIKQATDNIEVIYL